MGDVGLSGAAFSPHDPSERGRVAGVGWSRWTPVNLVAIATPLAGGAVIVIANRAASPARARRHIDPRPAHVDQSSLTKQDGAREVLFPPAS